jgi:Fic family protein
MAFCIIIEWTKHGTFYMPNDETARHYQSSHPWINFEFDLSQYPYTLWLLLGRIQAKCKTIATTPFLPELGDELRKIYLAKGVHATTAIEGNTLSEDQVRRYLDGDLRLPPSQEYLGQEVDNVQQLIRDVLYKDQRNFNVDRIKSYNAALLRGLALGEDVIAGEIRQHRVTVGRYLGAPAEDCEYLLGKLCDWLNTPLNAPPAYEVAFSMDTSLWRWQWTHRPPH